MDRKSKVLFLLLMLILGTSMFFTYKRFFVDYDYETFYSEEEFEEAPE